MADPDRWIQDALDAWLSPEPGTGPAGDEGWRERTGYLGTALERAQVGAAAAPLPPPAAGSAAPDPGAPPAPDAADWIAARYEEQRSALRTAMTGFMSRIMYFFPDRNAMTIDDLAAAAGLIAEQERQVHVAAGWAFLHRFKGRQELGREVEAALVELGQLKQAYALQRRSIEQREAERIREINRDRQAFVRAQDARRRELVRDTDDYIEELRRRPDIDRDRIRDRQHRDFLAYIRGERIFEVREL